MRFVHGSIVVLALLAMGIGGISTVRADDRQERAAAAGRQKVRAELVAALAKGYLTRMDQYRLLLHAQQVLVPDDLANFERSLDRIAMQRRGAAPASVTSGTVTYVEPRPAPETASRPPARSARRQPAEADDGDAPRMVRRSEYEQPDDAPHAAIHGETELAAPAAIDGTLEEAPPGAAHPTPAPIGQPVMQRQLEEGGGQEGGPGECCPDESCDECAACRCCQQQWFGLDGFTSVDAFKGPLDVGNANGNFGVRAGVNAALPLAQRWGIALQGGIAEELTNLKGSPYPFPNAVVRDQTFATVGVFQRINGCCGGAFTWGVAYDWDFDNYYTGFTFTQYRAKGEFEFSPWNAVGVEASVPDRGSTGQLPTFIGTVETISFRPISQGDLYWTHTFANDASLTGRFGVAEKPGEFVFGAEGHVPVTRNMALTGGFTYIMPNASGGDVAQTQEIWDVSVGVEFSLGGFRHCTPALRPFLPVADNGTLGVREVP